MKKVYMKVLAGFLAVALAGTTVFIVYSYRNPYGAIEGINKDTVLDSTEPLLPDRPYTTKADIENSLSPLQQILTADDVSWADLLETPEAEARILKAAKLTEVAGSQAEVRGLMALSASVSFMLSQISDGILPEDSVPYAKLNELQIKLDQLFDTDSLLGQVKVGNPMKGTWTTPDRVVLRWTPDQEWVPEDGYDIYRVIDGEAVLVAENLGNIALVPTFEGREYTSQDIKDLYVKATLDSSKMQVLGIKSAKEFTQFLNDRYVASSRMARFSGELDYKLEKDLLFSIPADIQEKVPQADFQTADLQLGENIQTLAVPIANISKLAMRPVMVQTGPAKALTEKEIVLSELINARKTLMAMAFTDQEFANKSGFGYEDNLEGLEIDTNQSIEYVVVPNIDANDSLTGSQIASGNQGKNSYSLSVAYGVEELLETPSELEGYGADNVVSLRWKAPGTEQAGIISGYNIERRRKDEEEFTKINHSPVAISYTEQADGLLCETPVFFRDLDVENGDELVYRIQALDIFGRVSEYSNLLEVKVYKVQAPVKPVLDELTLSTRITSLTPKLARQLAGMNKKIKGAILPIASSSPDTEIFIIYRSQAYGTGSFDTPQELVRIEVGPYLTSTRPIISSNLRKAKFVIRPDASLKLDTLYYDNTIEPGYYYKYWVAAADSWGNESEWSDSKTIGFPLGTAPESPSNPEVSLTVNENIKPPSDNPPGFLQRFTPSDKASPAPPAGIDLIETGVQPPSPAQIGLSLSDSVSQGSFGTPGSITLETNNLPDVQDVHELIALTGEDIAADGTARVSWYHYTGSGLSGYAVYRAYADGQTLEALGQMTREEILESYDWSLVQNNTQINQVIDSVEEKEGRIYLYFVFLIPQEQSEPLLDSFDGFVPGGWIKLSWERPDDPQISHFRVYRAGVPYFQEDQDMSSLEWTMVGDNLSYAAYSEKADQTYAHYYYFKVTSVDVWGEESEDGAIVKFRVPSTAPPQTPAMLVPFSKKETNEVNWMGVPHASRYIVYRHKLPRISSEDLQTMYEMQPTLIDTILNLPEVNDVYRVEINKLKPNISGGLQGINVQSPASKTPFAQGAAALKTSQLIDSTTMLKNIGNIKTSSKQDIFEYIEDQYGILALVPYANLGFDLAATIQWEEIAQIDIALGEDSSGPRQYLDTDVQFGDTYLYTVAAWNDDNLGSSRPEPVSVFTRKGSPFPAVTVKKGDKSGELEWSPAKDPNLSISESREHVAGYLVFRSNTKDGDYYQASPLLDKEKTSFIDVNANLSADNWYKVRVVDTAGYISEFSEPILITIKPTINKIDFHIIPIPGGTGLISGDGDVCSLEQRSAQGLHDPVALNLADNLDLSVAATLSVNTAALAPISPPAPILPPVIIQPPGPIVPIDPSILYISEEMTILGFQLTEVSLQGQRSGSGQAVLNLKGGYAVPVNVTINKFEKSVITDGTVSAQGSFALGDTGINLTGLDIKTRTGKALVAGYAMRPEGNLIGDLNRLEFVRSELTTGGLIHVISTPVFHYQGLTFTQVEKTILNFGSPADLSKTRASVGLSAERGFISLQNCLMETSLGLESMDNKGIEMKSNLVCFDQEGRLYGTFALNGSYGYLRTVIPAGLGIAANQATLVYDGGNVDAAKSSISGKIYLPFETFPDTIPADPPSLTGTLPLVDLAIRDRLSAGTSISAIDKDLLNMGMMYLAQVAQANSLLVVPQYGKLLDPKSSMPYSVSNWDGGGFMLNNASLSPALIPLYDPKKTDQKDAEMGITPYHAALDLRRDQVYSGEAPEDTKIPEWMGIVIKDGNVSLPPKYVQTEDNGRVRFNLTTGELLYDQNGFCYQNQAYTPEGVPVNFGDRLGGFTDVIVYNIVFDLYNNIANLEIEGSVAVPLFHHRVNVRLYKDKDSGEFVCTVAETEKFDPAGDGKVQIKVLGGYLDEIGMHLDGTLDYTQENSIQFADVQYNDLIVPANMNLLNPSGGDATYGRALFDKPYLVEFHEFPLEIRAMSMVSVPLVSFGHKSEGDYKGPRYSTTLTLWGGMQLSDNLALNTAEDTDRIVIEKLCHSPSIQYEESKSQLTMTFEDYADFKGVGTPIVVDGEEGLVEYDTSDMEMAFNNACDLLPCKDLIVNARIGYDKVMERSYFAIAIHYEGPPGIRFSIAEINVMNGMLGYNMNMDKNEDGTFKITADDKSFINMVDTMAVNRTPGGNYFFAVSCNMTLGYESIKLGELRNVYMVVEKGPCVEMGGYYYGPASVDSLATGSNLKEMGYAHVGYYHPQRQFKFSMSLYDLGMYGFVVSGDLGFEITPDMWELRIGYPNMLLAKAGGVQEIAFGLGIRNAQDEDWIKAKAHYGYDTGDVTIGIVYVRGYLKVGGEGEYNFTNDSLWLHVYLNGGVSGGVKALGKKFEVISLTLNAQGDLVKTDQWRLSAEARIYYHVDLWLDDISGSVGWHISYTF